MPTAPDGDAPPAGHDTVPALAPMPPAEVAVDGDLVGRLLAEQSPDLAGLPLSPVPQIGWDNALFRLGDELVVRLPRRALASELVAHEQRWLPLLAPRLPLPVPVPERRGRPGCGYPWAWSVCPWLPGTMAARHLPGAGPPLADAPPDQDAVAVQLAGFLRALHRPAPPEAPRHRWRGVPLADRDRDTRERIERLGPAVDGAALVAAWEAALAVPAWTGPRLWVHGDLHPGNLLLGPDGLAGVLDFGDLNGGDPACDLVSGWMLLDAAHRPRLRAAAGIDDATWGRGRGWALSVGLACLASSADNPVIAAIGRRAVGEVLSEHASGHTDP